MIYLFGDGSSLVVWVVYGMPRTLLRLIPLFGSFFGILLLMSRIRMHIERWSISKHTGFHLSLERDVLVSPDGFSFPNAAEVCAALARISAF